MLAVVDGNPRPGPAAFHVTPLSGRAEAATRIDLAAAENIIVAGTGDGQFFAEQKQVKAAIGGCAG